MKYEKKKKLYIIILVLLVTTILVSVGYSVLSSTLSVSYSSVQQNNIKWDVGFKLPDGQNSFPYTVDGQPTSYNNNTTGISCGTATVTRYAITLSDIKVSKPGDRCQYNFVIENSGDINSKLTVFNFISPKKNGTSTSETCEDPGDPTLTERICGKIRYRFCKDSTCGTRFQQGGSPIAAGATQTAYLRVYYNDDVNLTETTTYQNGAKFELTWGQN